MAYWWVSQNRTFQQERAGGYIWAPKQDRGGNTPHHWQTMTEVAPGDVIFSYVGQTIRALGVAKTAAYDADRPADFVAGDVWENSGRRVDVEYRDPPALPLAAFVDEIYALLPDRYSPLTAERQGAQGYLFALPSAVGRILLDRLSEQAGAPIDEEIDRALERTVPDKTTRKAIVEARVGQGRFRDDLFRQWSGRCALTGFDIAPLLRASHIKPWRDSNNAERVDPMNGLLLSPGCDAAFDSGLISFDDDGNMLVSPDLTDDQLVMLGFRRDLRLTVAEGHRPYLAQHRRSNFRTSETS